MRKLTPNMLVICLDEINHTQLRGCMYSIMCHDPIVFDGIDQMILKADKLFDEIGYPQSFQMKRSMREVKRQPYERLSQAPVLQDDAIFAHHGKKKRCILLVNTRQHTEWQGMLFDGLFSNPASFDNIIEFVNLLVKL